MIHLQTSVYCAFSPRNSDSPQANTKGLPGPGLKGDRGNHSCGKAHTHAYTSESFGLVWSMRVAEHSLGGAHSLRGKSVHQPYTKYLRLRQPTCIAKTSLVCPLFLISNALLAVPEMEARGPKLIFRRACRKKKSATGQQMTFLKRPMSMVEVLGTLLSHLLV